MKTLTRQERLPDVLHAILARQPPRPGVLSVYLDTSPERVVGQGHLQRYRDALLKTAADVPCAERAAFEETADRVETYIANEMEATHPGIAIFAARPSDFFYAGSLPSVPKEDIKWAERAQVAPLQEMIDEFERIGLIVFDGERARLFTIALGEIEQQTSIEGSLWNELSVARRAAFLRPCADTEDQVAQMARRAAYAMLMMLQARRFERLVLAGPDSAIVELEKQLPRALQMRLKGTIEVDMFAGDQEILDRAMKASATLERGAETGAVSRLLAQAPSRFVVLGLGSVLDALVDHRLSELVIVAGFDADVSTCALCGRLAAEDTCVACGAFTLPVRDPMETIVAQALDQGAGVEIVHGDAALRLAEQGGIAGWTRY